MTTKTRPLSGWWILAALVGFFGVIMLANTVLIKLAGQSWTGLVTDHAYEKGLAYNTTLAARAAEEALGWHVTTHFTQTDATSGTLNWAVTNSNGQSVPVTGHITLDRPLEGGHTITHPLSTPEIPLTVPFSGQWQATLELHHNGQSLTAQQRLYFN